MFSSSLPSIWINIPELPRELIEKYPRYEIQKGTIIYAKGENNPYLFYLHEGIVKISLFSKNGHEKILGFHLPNSLFGLDCLIENCQAVVNATAYTNVIVSRLKQSEIHMMLEEHPKLASTICAYYCSILRLMCFQAENHCFYDTLTKIVNFLYLTASTDNSTNRTICLKEEELAALTGNSRVHVSRVLKELKERNLIKTARGKIIITDPERLFKLCCF
ncbi:MAG: Crp/Fnr family transcriptional regulator [Thermacetogeniaceae bacterium]